MRTFRQLLLIFAVCSCWGAGWHLAAMPVKDLPPYYRQWIEEVATYIVTQDERRAYLQLRTDAERDQFIEQFWESRNPTPHSLINTFKEEHYRRLAYVRTEFGDDRYNDGWRTDMGRVYITLGPPEQRGVFHQGMSTRPVEIWFYQSPSPALPIYFNLVFYKRSETDLYTLYSPRNDGPTRVVTNDLHDDAQALRTIDKSMGAEATHAMVSLIPGEPISIDHPNPTMSSDLLLDEVRNLPEQKLEKERIARLRASNREIVTSSLFTGFNAPEIETVVLHDLRGLSTVHYMVRNQQPDGLLIGTLSDKRTGYQMTLTTRVLTDSGKAIYERKDELSASVSAGGAKAGREKTFAAEGTLPLVPGNYMIESTVINDLNRNASRSSAHVTVPAEQADSVTMSGLMVYRGRPEQTLRDRSPFTLAGLRFAPRGDETVEIHAGEGIPLVYQLWIPTNEIPSKAAGIKPRNLHVHYTLGSVQSSAAERGRLEEDQDVSLSEVDAAGNLVMGHTLDTTNLGEGSYRLVVRLTDPGTGRSAYGTMSVRIVPSQVPVEMWSAYGDQDLHPIWQDDLLRGLAAEAVGNPREARAAYERVLAIKPGVTEAINRLEALPK